MPSITDKIVISSQRILVTDETVAEGLTVLRDIICHVRLPHDLATEEAALAALAALQDGIPLTRKAEVARDDLYADMARLKREEVTDLLRWIQSRIVARRHRCDWRRATKARHLHLLILLAKIVAPLYKFAVIQELDALGACPDRDDAYRLLAWLPRFIISPRKKRLAKRYIKLTVAVWYGDYSRPPYSQNRHIAIEFVSWPVHRRLLELLAWRECWRGEQRRHSFPASADDPSVYADGIEFLLAKSRTFRGMRRSGGPVVRAILNDLGYRDHPRQRTRHYPVRYLITAGAFIFLTLVTLKVKREAVRNWHAATTAVVGSLRAELVRELQDYLTPSASESIQLTHGPICELPTMEEGLQ